MAKNSHAYMIAGVFLLLGVGITWFLTSGGTTPGSFTPTPQPETQIECLSTTSPTVTLSTPDVYGGAAVTTQNIVRKMSGSSPMISTSDVAGAGTFDANAGDTYQIMFGIDSDDDDEEPYGPIVKYTVPCEENPELEIAVVDDAEATDLTAIAFDPDDGNQITTSDDLDVDAGEIKTVKFRWTGSFEEDFGNRWCEDDDGVKNVLVVRYNTSTFDKVYATDLSGNKLPTAGIAINRILSSSSGMTDDTFWFPVIRSNADYEYKLVLDADSTEEPKGSYSNVTAYLYDVSHYIDNDVTPQGWLCGIMDEDANEVGAAAADSLSIYLEED